MYSFPLGISCIWHGICNMMYRHLCILGCMHLVLYAFRVDSFEVVVAHEVTQLFSKFHCNPWSHSRDRAMGS
jgi:hypothetical protein